MAEIHHNIETVTKTEMFFNLIQKEYVNETFANC